MRGCKLLDALPGLQESELDFSECCNLAQQEEGLLEEALLIFPASRFSVLHARLLTCLADSLSARKDHRRAMMAYLAIQPPDLAKVRPFVNICRQRGD
jgi:hypothetical protein